jgi:hypothetical protein
MYASRREARQRKRLGEILVETGITMEDYTLIKSGSRKRRLTEYKLCQLTDIAFFFSNYKQ